MKTLKKALCALALALAGLGVLAAPALAEEYKYTVRVFGGNQGTVATGSKTYTYDPANPTEVDVVKEFGEPDVKDKDKYYFKYYRIAGQDDNASNSKAIVTVDHDIDLVAAYGAYGKDKMKTVTIQFVAQDTGAVLGTTSVDGKVDDRIVEGYEYFEGYRPQARNITGIVKADDADNVWTLLYYPVEAGEGTETVTTNTTYYDNPVTVTGGGTAAGGAAAGGAAAGGAAAGGAAAGGAATEGGAAAGGETAAPAAHAAPETQEILDVDNPLAAPDAQGDGTGSEGGAEGTGTGTENIEGEGNPAANAGITGNPALMGGVAAGVAAVAGLLYFMMKKKSE